MASFFASKANASRCFCCTAFWLRARCSIRSSNSCATGSGCSFPTYVGMGKAAISMEFDSRPWLKEINAPTLVVGGTHDFAMPRHHFDTLVNGIPGAFGRLVDRAGHTLVWTHTRELAEIICAQ